jgi:hypothetical protein
MTGAPTRIGDLGALAGVFHVDTREHYRTFAIRRGGRIKRLVDERTAAQPVTTQSAAQVHERCVT